MIRLAHWLLTVLIFLLGALHTGIGFYCKHLNEDTLWFIGSGIAIIFAGLFNLLAILTSTKSVQIVATAVNLVAAGLFILALQVMSEVQVYVGLALFILAALLSFLRNRPH